MKKINTEHAKDTMLTIKNIMKNTSKKDNAYNELKTLLKIYKLRYDKIKKGFFITDEKNHTRRI